MTMKISFDNIGQLPLEEAVFLLRLCSQSLNQILTTILDEKYPFLSNELDEYYQPLKLAIEKLLSRQDKELDITKAKFPKYFFPGVRTDLSDKFQDDIADWTWFKLPPFITVVDGLFRKLGEKEFALDANTAQFFKELNKALERYKADTPRRWKELERKEKAEQYTYSATKRFNCLGITLDLEQTYLQYKDFPPIEISPDNKAIRMLELLMRRLRLVEYVEIAEELELNCYNLSATNQDVAREVQFLKRDLNHILKKAGMTMKEINKTIVAKKNLGYKLDFYSH